MINLKQIDCNKNILLHGDKWQPLLLLFLSISIYSLSLLNDFVFDDIRIFLEDPRIRSLKGAMTFFVEGFFPPAEYPFLQYYRPLVGLFHALEYAVFGTNPFGYKLMNLLLNGLVVMLAWKVVRHLSLSSWLPLLAGALYAVVPARADAVYWAYSDSYLLVALFCLLSLCALQAGRPVLAFVAYVCALLSQEVAVVFPLIAGVYFWLKDREQIWRNLGGMLLLICAYLVVRTTVVGSLPVGALSVSERFYGMLAVVSKAFRVLVWPEGMLTVYGYVPGKYATPDLEVLYGAVLLGVSLVFCWYWARQRDPRLLWLVWSWVWLLPAFNFGAIGDYFFAEKSIYLAALGPCVLLAEFLLRLRSRLLALALAVLIIVPWSGLVVARAESWRDNKTYLEQLLQFDPGFTILHLALGDEYRRRGDYDRELREFLIAYEQAPQSPMVKLSLSGFYERQAWREAQRGDAAAQEQSLRKALSYNPANINVGNNLGALLLARGDFTEAERLFLDVLRVDGRQHNTVVNLARLYLKKNQPQSARKVIEQYRSLGGKDSQAIRDVNLSINARR